ncbi:MAG: glycolate oxidase subunit GlcE [Rhodospirillaceae bacterium]|jgi:glycolate oxidase FAD binding subunit|nr:glycolate oxidase subunit GlcE [Rhodospirillaceae bacterium]MBT5245197.1 glycolate oxidase subunit GlcE [Rhodospirillaceae bacterium]MBT5561923.1 glycolate oxidase subunit GlcE [Rhodospirillaceae bacterium]MBT6241959.1 glycolate oxidase subunit GlcE [Rhodospirillaceae bacterium]MBT7138587.1 glycolate oxidase subunit GlcE [Rhodospirillaceae bacterium]
MGETYKPDTPEQVLDAVKWALAEEQTLDVFGHASKRNFGCPASTHNNLDLSALSGITLYEPAELVMSAAAATPMSEIQSTIDEHNQRLAFEPPNFGPLLDSGPEAGTIGGVLACNLAGPRRISAGSARDHILGFHAVSGRGEVFKSGGRVVKNVTGFDLSKLLAGSFGTLAVMTDVTFKVLPVPEKSRTVLVMTEDHAKGVAAMRDALHSSYEVSAAAYLPADIAALSDVSYVSSGKGGHCALRVEGPGPSVEYRTGALRQLLAGFGETEELHTTNTNALWREIRDVAYFVSGGEQLWRLSVPPSEGARVMQKIAESIGGRAFLDWGGGLIWFAIKPRDNAAHQEIRAILGDVGGHGTLIRTSDDVRARVPVFQPQQQALADLSARIKDSFDPMGILCPGRMG